MDMDMQLAVDKLLTLEAKRIAASGWQKLYEERRAAILAYVRDDLEALDAEMKPYLDQTSQEVSEAEAEVKSAVLNLGETVKGKTLMAVYMSGKTTWDGGKLDGMAAIIPELNQARKTGEPSVQLRVQK